MFGEDQRVVDNWPFKNVDYVLGRKTVHICKVQIIARRFNRSYADIASDNLDVKVALDFANLFHLLLELFIGMCLVDWPVLEGKGLIHRPDRLIERHH